MANDKRVIAYLRAHYQEIISSYIILSSKKITSSWCVAGAFHTPLPILDVLKQGIASFSNTCDLYPAIIKHCRKKNIEETTLYKKAHVSKTVFSKIRSMKTTKYKPGKNTVICLCLALELNGSKTSDMLGIIGYSLSNAIVADKIVSYCISKEYYDVYEIENLILEKTGASYLYS